MTQAASRAPASAAAARIASISESLRPGITGAAMTAVGTPASASARIAPRRFAGALARGSIRLARRRSSVVTDTAARASRRAAIGARMSRSRRISADLVTMVTGWPHSARTLRIPRVMRRSRSTGW